MPVKTEEFYKKLLADEKKKVEILEKRIEIRRRALYTALQKSAETNNKQKLFLINISHELRSPLHAIINFSKLGTEKIKKGHFDKVLTYLGHIYDSGIRLLKLINSLSDFTKLESGKSDFNFGYHNLVEITNKAIAEVAHIVKEKLQEITIDNKLDNPTIYCDSDRIYQVVVNLLTNASKFSPPDSSIKITLKNQSSTSFSRTTMLQFEIADHGPGIKENELSTIFEQFYQSPSTKHLSTEGLGLGLAICKKIIDMHHGKIWAINKPDGGACFIFTIPSEKTESGKAQSTHHIER